MNYIALYVISQGLNGAITSMVAARATNLAGCHVHRMFRIPIKKNCPIYRLAEYTLINLMKDPVSFHILTVIDVLFFDEIGQCSAENLSLLDIIFRKVRKNNIFFGGVLLIGTLDHKQLAPINGKPFLLSSHVLSCFEFTHVEESVRASGQIDFQRIQNIARMHPDKYEENPELIDEFEELLLSTCTFVSSWNDEKITPSTYRLYGKRMPAKEATDCYIQQVKSQLPENMVNESLSNDIQMAHGTQSGWTVASETTSNFLDRKMKESRRIIFFVGAIYQFTYNDDRFRFNQSQLGLLISLPSQSDLDKFRKIKILVAPPGLKDFIYDETLSLADYIERDWEQHSVGLTREKTFNTGGFKARRRQYGLKHHVNSTVHASMGNTLSTIVTEISEKDSNYELWDKAQAIVLLSRTCVGSDIIFVGSKRTTCAALVKIIKLKCQYMDYMECVLDLVTTNDSIRRRPIFQHQNHPFRFCDIPLPQCNTGFVYMLISIRDHSYIYIGMTLNLCIRILQHNLGYGATGTASASYRPFCLFAYICGFNCNKALMLHVETQWKVHRNRLIENGNKCPKAIARSANNMLENMTHISQENISHELRLICNFTD